MSGSEMPLCPHCGSGLVKGAKDETLVCTTCEDDPQDWYQWSFSGGASGQ